MAIRQIRIAGDPILNKVCKEVKEVTPMIKTLIDDMLDTMYEANGVGLAAPQVTYIMKDLQDRGYDVSDEITTIAEARDEIKSYFTRLGAARKER